jgi:hypothetical protein
MDRICDICGKNITGSGFLQFPELIYNEDMKHRYHNKDICESCDNKLALTIAEIRRDKA